MNDKTTPAILGGIFIGVTSALPGINLLNCFCCGLVIGGGIIAARSLIRNSPLPISTTDGAVVGLIAGGIGAAIKTVLEIPIKMLLFRFGADNMSQLRDIIDSIEGMPPGVKDMVSNMMTGTMSVAAIMVEFLFALVIYAIFATIGGMLGVKIFEKRPPGLPPSSSMPPPPYNNPAPPPPLQPPSIDRF